MDPNDPLALILGKLTERSEATNTRVDAVEDTQDDHGGRLGVLETWKQKITGGVILLGLMAPLFVLGIRESIADLLFR